MEKVMVVGVWNKKYDKVEIDEELSELEALVSTAGGEVIEKVVQKRENFDPAYLIGRGKLKKIQEKINNNGIRSVIFNNNLSPTHQRNLEEALGVKIVDRTRLILDIFAHRARSSEGKLQVELAQLKYMLPRLTKKGIWLDGQFGGIGTRGPGEKKLEYDRRKITQRITKLERDIKEISLHREQQRKRRKRMGIIPTVAIVGYTNVGKSTLLNTLSKKDAAYVDDRLFATLDPVMRRVRLCSGRYSIFTDTVGFIRDLPPLLISAFKATLEETLHADLILHLIDISNPNYETQRTSTMKIINDLRIDSLRIFEVYNKSDLLSPEIVKYHEKNGKILISAKTGYGIENLLLKVERFLNEDTELKKFFIPYQRQSLLYRMFDLQKPITINYTDEGMEIEISVNEAEENLIKELLNTTKI